MSEYVLTEQDTLDIYHKAMRTLREIIHEYYSGNSPEKVYGDVENILKEQGYLL